MSTTHDSDPIDEHDVEGHNVEEGGMLPHEEMQVTYPHGADMPHTITCPTCASVLVLPPRIFVDEPIVCGECDTEMDDPRAASQRPAAHILAPGGGYTAPEAPSTPIEQRKTSRSGLLRHLGGYVAEKGISRIPRIPGS